MALTLIANTGIQVFTFKLHLDLQDKFKMWFHERYDSTNGEWILDILHEVLTESSSNLYKKKVLHDYGYLSEVFEDGYEMVSSLSEEQILPVCIDDEMKTDGEVFKMTFADKNNTLKAFENKWLPIPYFFRRTETKFRFGALNWSHFKLVPVSDESGVKKGEYIVLLAFDTRAKYASDHYEEYPIFPDEFRTEMTFSVCDNEFQIMDFSSPKDEWRYINDYLFKLVHPNISDINKIRTGLHLNHIASYIYLINFIASKKLFPDIVLYKDDNVEAKDVDMVIDIGNSRTTVLLVEDNATFNQVEQLGIVDYTRLLDSDGNEPKINVYQEPFDMRLAFRRVSFGDFGINGSRQFVYPSFVRLGKEANYLIHKTAELSSGQEKLTTHSSPKRYLWDYHRNKDEWKFLVLEGETDNHILNIPGLSEILRSDGSVAQEGEISGLTHYYSNRSLMTFALLEMLVQAVRHTNDHQYRIDRGDLNMPRNIRRMIITCPTAMSKFERDALVKCASDAVKLLNNFTEKKHNIEIVPSVPSFKDKDGRWFYDEATCSQLVYIYGEIGYKYKGACQEFFNLYGKVLQGDTQPSITIGSLDIGAGTSDLMICKYSYRKGDVITVMPDPLFYDSFYYAGDDMLNELIKKVMFFSPNSALRRNLPELSDVQYRQKLRDFFGPDYSGQTIAERKLRRDFNLQYSVPLLYHFLELLSTGSVDCVVRYNEVFDDCPPNQRVINGFENYFGFKLESLEWEFKKSEISDYVAKAFEPLLKKRATIMHTYNCDIVLLSGRPASLPPIRDIFLKYYSVSPNRLILLNNYYVGHWYPFGENTGYIANSKTIVAMGALIGYYATSLGNLDRFVIDKTKLDSNLKSTINYIEASREGQPINYFITPERATGDLMVSSLPTRLNVRQIEIDSYPSRKLYVIDFNQYKIADKIRRKAIMDGITLSDAQVNAMVKDQVESLRLKMPFNMTIERDQDDKEKITIVSITDRNGNDIMDSCVEISLRSLNSDDRYWLDTGAFEIH